MSSGGVSLIRKALARLAGKHFGGDRDLYEAFGYPRSLSPQDYVDSYLRGDLAARIVDAYPDATWREAPTVSGAATEDIEALEKRLKLWRTFHRLDRLTNMGHYGVLFLGLDGGEPPHQPAEGSDYRLLYLQPHGEATADITQWEDNPRSPRFGMPKMYRITSGVNWTGSGANQRSFNVHYSRVVHVAERALEDASIGTPRLERVWNRFMDLEKLLGGGAEIYWQNSAMMLAFVADAGVRWDEDTKEEMKDQLDEMQHGLRRMLRLQGVKPENIAPGLQGADPSPFIDKTLDAIAGASGIPKRILIGSERGELSSEQDENNWAGRIEERREQFAAPNVIEPFIQRGQSLGFLPKGEFDIAWPESDTMGESARATITKTKAEAIAAYSSTPGAELFVAPGEFRRWLGLEGEPEFIEEEPLDEGDEEVLAQFPRRVK